MSNPFLHMKANTFVVLALSLFACTPAYLKPPPSLNGEQKSTVLIHRDTSLFSMGVGAVIGLDGRDVGVLGNGGFLSVDVPPGKNELYVRDTMAGPRYVLPVSSEPGKMICLNVTKSTWSYASLFLLGIPNYAASRYHLEQFDCPSETELSKNLVVKVNTAE